MNWLVGVLLLALTISMAFTGQVLRWDQDGVWSAVVGAEQAARTPLVGQLLARFLLSGDNISGETLSHIFRVSCVFIIPGLIIAGISLHLYLVLRNGISEPPVVDEPVNPATYRAKYQHLLQSRGRPFWPDVIWRDIVFGTGVLLLIVAGALIIGPRPLGLPPDPSLTAADPRPDWYLIWYFALLAVLPSRLENLLIWLLPLTVGAVMIALPLRFPRGQRHPARRPWAWTLVACAVVAIGVLLRIGLHSPWTPAVDAPPLTAAIIASSDRDVVHGAVLFHDHGCEACHAIAGIGGRYGPALTYAGDRLSDLDLATRIENGGHNMPAFGRYLSAADIRQIVAFLRSRTRASGAPANAH